MSISQSNIGMPVEQGFYTLILGIMPNGSNDPIFFYNEADQRANGCIVDGVITAKGKTWEKLLGLA